MLYVQANILPENTPDRMSLVLNVLLALHTSAYEKQKTTKSFTPVFLGILLPLFMANTYLYYRSYLKKKRVFWNFTTFWLGTIASYTSFFSFQGFWIVGNSLIMGALAVIYIAIFAYRSFMHYLYNINARHTKPVQTVINLSRYSRLEHFDVVSEDRLVVVNAIEKKHLWWNVNFRSMSYRIDDTERKVRLDSVSFVKTFKNTGFYDSIIIGNLTTCFTDNNYDVRGVICIDKYTYRVYYEEVDSLKTGTCYNDLRNLHPFRRIHVRYGGNMNRNNHVSTERFNDSVEKFAFIMHFGQGWFKKDLDKIRPSQNNCAPLEPLSHENRIKEKDKFIMTLPDTGNRKRLSAYLEECINWYHGKRFKKVATVEYRKRWANHRNWILGSPILEETLKNELVIEVTRYYEEKTVTEVKEVSVHAEHRPIANPGEDDYLRVSLVPNSRTTPPPVIIKNGDKYIEGPAPGFTLKNYKASVVRLCACGEVEDFQIFDEVRREAKVDGTVSIGFIIRWNTTEKRMREVKNKVVEKVKEVKKPFIREAPKEDLKASDVKIKDVFPDILSEKAERFVIPKFKAMRNTFLNKLKQGYKASRKAVIKNNSRALKDVESPNIYSRKRKRLGLKVIRCGKEIIEKKLHRRIFETNDLTTHFHKLLELNGFPPCNPNILKCLDKNKEELHKMFRVSRKQIAFIRSAVKYDFKEIVENVDTSN